MDDDLCYLSKTEAQIWITIAFILGMVIMYGGMDGLYRYLERKKPRIHPEAVKQQARVLHQRGWVEKDIAVFLGVARSNVYRWVRQQ